MSASPPTWKTGDTGPKYSAFLQQAGGASVLSLSAASSVEFIAKNSGNTATSVRIKGTMTIASAAQGYVTYAWGASDLIFADTYNAEYEINWQDGTTETVPNDSFDTFTVLADLEGDPLGSDPV
jgi:hypothetical protein